jgi:hypothetical protein
MISLFLLAPLIIYTISTEPNETSNNTPVNKTNLIIDYANLITANFDYVYIVEQVVKCSGGIKDPVRYSDCEAAIIDPIATCCRVITPDNKSICLPVASKYPAYFKYSFIKANYTIDCPLLNEFNGSYNNTLIASNYSLSFNEALVLVNSTMIATDMPDPYFNCLSTKNPNSYESCSKAIDSPNAKCCYVRGVKGRYTANLCQGITNESYHIWKNLYEAQAGATLDCGSSNVNDNHTYL